MQEATAGDRRLRRILWIAAGCENGDRRLGAEAPVAQWIEQPVSTRSVGGSSPSGRASSAL